MSSNAMLTEVEHDLMSWSLDPRASAAHWRAAYGILEVVRLHARAPHAALYSCRGTALRLLALRGIHQDDLDLVERLWQQRMFLTEHVRVADELGCLILSCGCPNDLTGTMDRPAGVVILRWPSSRIPHDVAGLPALANVIGRLLRRLEQGTPLDDLNEPNASRPEPNRPRIGEPSGRCSLDAQAVALRALLEAQEWNVARVARILGVTRMTIYNRLRRLQIPRERVLKSAAALQRAANGAPFDTIATPVEDGSRTPHTIATPIEDDSRT